MQKYRCIILEGNGVYEMSGKTLESEYLTRCKAEKIAVVLLHGNGARTTGVVVDFDETVIIVEYSAPRLPPKEPMMHLAMVYRRAVTNIFPLHEI